MSRTVAETGKLCLEAAHQLIIHHHHHPEEAIEKLRSLEEDGKTLHKSAMSQKEKLQKKEKESENMLTTLHKERERCESRKRNLKKEKSGIELSYTREETSLKNAQEDLEKAESGLRDAESSLEYAKGQREKTMALSFFGTALATLAFGPIGFAAGAVTGAVAISNEENNVERARNRKDQCNRTVRDAESCVNSTRQSLQRIESDIKDCNRKLSQCETQIEEKHRKIAAMRQSIAVLIEAEFLWEMLGQAATHATERTEFLKRIVKKAEEFQKREILTSKGTVIMATTFIEAWEAIAGQAADTRLRN